MFTVTESQIAELSGIKDRNRVMEITNALNATMSRFYINTSLRRVRYFVAQCMSETQNFNKFSEDLTYKTPERLVQVWPSRFTMDKDNKAKNYAPNYVNNPVGLANLVYANRGGNGPAESGNGYNFRGSGALHLTFKTNFKLASLYLYGDERLVHNPDLVRTNMNVAFDTAGWFWEANKCNILADQDAFTKLTGVINGSTATAPARLQILAKVNRVIK